jgi:rare lipoprotein A
MRNLLALVLVFSLVGVQHVAAETTNIPMLFYGEASWYGDTYHGRNTASGETYDMTMLTAAHRTLPFGTLVRVTNLENDKSVTVRVNDRGPFAKDRVIDVSRAAASLLDFQNKGTAKVEIRVVQLGDGKMQPASTTASAAPVLAKPEANTTLAAATPETKQEETPKLETPKTVVIVEPKKTDEDAPSDGPRIIRPQDVTFRDSGKIQGSENGRIVIQAGAFLSLDNAENLLRQFQSMGLPVFIRQFSGERLHRVWVGPFAQKSDADQVIDRVRTRADQAFVRTRN